MTAQMHVEKYSLRPIAARCHVTQCETPASRLVRSTSDGRVRPACLKCFRLMTEFEYPNWEPAEAMS